MKKFYVGGAVRVTHVSRTSGKEKIVSGSFDRVVYATDAMAARNMVADAVKAKWLAGNKVCSAKDFGFVHLEVFESVICEEGNY